MTDVFFTVSEKKMKDGVCFYKGELRHNGEFLDVYLLPKNGRLDGILCERPNPLKDEKIIKKIHEAGDERTPF